MGGILTPQPGIKPSSPASEVEVLTTGPPGKSQAGGDGAGGGKAGGERAWGGSYPREREEQTVKIANVD